MRVVKYTNCTICGLQLCASCQVDIWVITRYYIATVKEVTRTVEEKEVDSMRDEFKAVLLLILNMLERGEDNKYIVVKDGKEIRERA